MSECCLRGHPKTEENTYRPPRGRGYCRPCKRIRQKEYAKSRAGKIAAPQGESAGKAARRLARSELEMLHKVAAPPDTAINRRAQLKIRYGLSEAEYDELVAFQNGLCAVCGKKARLVVDHCHKSGSVRGLLCTRCNLQIGTLEANPGWVDRVADYLGWGA